MCCCMLDWGPRPTTRVYSGEDELRSPMEGHHGKRPTPAEAPRKQPGHEHLQRLRAPEHHNFDPFDFSFQPNASARRDYIKARHADEPLAKAYMNPTTNNQLGLTASSALEMLGLHMPLRAAMNGWDMAGVLQEVLNAVGVTAEGATFTAAEATVRLKQVLRGHRLDDHKRNLEAGPEPRSQGPAAIWLRPPAWPPAKAISWLGDTGLTAMIGLAGKDLGCRLRMPIAPDGNTPNKDRDEARDAHEGAESARTKADDLIKRLCCYMLDQRPRPTTRVYSGEDEPSQPHGRAPRKAQWGELRY